MQSSLNNECKQARRHRFKSGEYRKFANEARRNFLYLSLFCPVVEFRGKTGGTKWKVNRTSTSMFTVNLEWTFLKATSNKIRSCSQFVRTLAFGNFFAGCSSYGRGLATKPGRLRLTKHGLLDYLSNLIVHAQSVPVAPWLHEKCFWLRFCFIFLVSRVGAALVQLALLPCLHRR